MSFFLKVIPFFIYTHFSGTQLGHKTRLWYIYLVQLQSTVLYSTVLYSTVLYCTVLYSTVQHSTAQHSTAQYSTVQYSTVQYSTVQYITSSVIFIRSVTMVDPLMEYCMWNCRGIARDDSFHNIVHIKYTSGNGKYPTYILTAIYVVMEISNLNVRQSYAM